MGKFFDALQKSGSKQERPAPKRSPENPAKMPAETIESLRLNSSAPEEPGDKFSTFNGRIHSCLTTALDAQCASVDCFKLLRTKVLTSNLGRNRTIMVTSPQPLDGKSVVAANLAISIAQGMKEHVLLLDCDLRRPSQHQLFGFEAHLGLREYLEDGNSVAPHLLKTPVKKLTLLPAGRPPSNPSELISSEKMRLLVTELKARYQDRYIILDATPAKFAAETAFLAHDADCVLLVVRSGKTLRETALEAIEHIGREKILGVVFNANTEVQRKYQYYYRYYKKSQA